ncbi:MAG: DUF4197 domain-containing protein, partial [Candidatus Accumulibacter sp.]|nr:DUF4197 domain-containing protein [Accumulibacter sp.]
DSLTKAEKALRLLGQGDKADALRATLNHAAEQAVAEAKPILEEAIRNMEVRDAVGILSGGDDAATQYFRRVAEEPLAQKFLPIVQKATSKLNLTAQYNNYAGQAAQLGLIKKSEANLDNYVNQKALDGLFLIMAEREKTIRANPLQVGSQLLQKAFGKK